MVAKGGAEVGGEGERCRGRKEGVTGKGFYCIILNSIVGKGKGGKGVGNEGVSKE